MKDFLKIFKDFSLFEVFIMSMFGGMPMGIFLTTLSAWLTESNIPLEIITTFAFARLPFSLKFLWSPLVDFVPVPFLISLGHRRSRLMLCALLVLAALLIFSQVDPNKSLTTLYVVTLILGFLTATMDINLDAFRIEKLKPELLGIGAANAVLGYRIGMLITGPAALGIADYTGSWEKTFIIVSLIYALSIIFIFYIREPELERNNNLKFSFQDFLKVTIDSFKDYLNKDMAYIILLAVVIYKLGESLLSVVCTPFYLELGFTKTQIAIITKVYGFFAYVVGAYVGGIIVYRIGHLKALVWGGVVQSITHLAFVWLNHQGADLIALYITITIENFAVGVGGATFVAYLSKLCSKQYSATQYALLSSAAGLCNNSITAAGGKLARIMGWDLYFIFTVILGLPGILLFVYLGKIKKNKELDIDVTI